LSDLFVKAFGEALHAPNLRPTAEDWEKALYKTFNIIHPSPNGSDWFVVSPGLPMQCPVTSKRITAEVPYALFYSENRPGNFLLERNSLTIYHNLGLMPWHTRAKIWPDEKADRTRQGYFSKHQGHWYLTNESEKPMQVVNGPMITRGQNVEIRSGLQLRASLEPNGRLLVFDFMHP
jgi:hypothetical protein